MDFLGDILSNSRYLMLAFFALEHWLFHFNQNNQMFHYQFHETAEIYFLISKQYISLIVEWLQIWVIVFGSEIRMVWPLTLFIYLQNTRCKTLSLPFSLQKWVSQSSNRIDLFEKTFLDNFNSTFSEWKN